MTPYERRMAWIREYLDWPEGHREPRYVELTTPDDLMAAMEAEAAAQDQAEGDV